MSNSEIKLLVTKELAQQALDSIVFPLKITLPDTAFAPEDDYTSESYSGVEARNALDADTEALRHTVYCEDNSKNNAILLRDMQLDLDSEDIEIVHALHPVEPASPLLDDEGEPLTLERVGRLKQALLKPLKKVISIALIWAKLEVDKPGFTLGEQILILDMDVIIQIKFSVCIKLLGKKISKTFSTDRITLAARQVNLDLLTSGAKVYMLPSFTDLDVGLNFSMFGLTFATRPKITSIINRQLKHQGPLEIIDLSSFSQAIPFSTATLAVSSITFESVPSGLAINMKMKLV